MSKMSGMHYNSVHKIASYFSDRNIIILVTDKKDTRIKRMNITPIGKEMVGCITGILDIMRYGKKVKSPHFSTPGVVVFDIGDKIWKKKKRGNKK